MKVLIIGGGGREHALFWKISQSRKVSDVFLSHENGGVPKSHQLKENILEMSMPQRRDFLKKEKFDLIVVGPELPIANGDFDGCRDIVPVFAPSPACARLESSKIFAKQFLKKYGIPTASALVFDDHAKAQSHVEALQDVDFPIVVKYDGLAQGKGVTVAFNKEAAQKALHAAMVQKVFQDASAPAATTAATATTVPRVMIEDFLPGDEASLFLLCDGVNYRLFPASRDYKRAYDQNEGANTGGMGATAPLFELDEPELATNIRKEILDPLLSAIAKEMGEYRGLLYIGLMIDKKRAYVVEFNVRFGDPETQALLPLLAEDLLPLLEQASEGRFQSTEKKLSLREGMKSLVVVVAAEGYPEQPIKGMPVEFAPLPDGADMRIFHGGTKYEMQADGAQSIMQKEGRLVNIGGRVLNVNAVAGSIAEGRSMVYNYLEHQTWNSFRYRRDIGLHS